MINQQALTLNYDIFVGFQLWSSTNHQNISHRKEYLIRITISICRCIYLIVS